ncbi:MAG: zinc ribbon domain-containing protein [Prochloraceae cyanobacterium]|nr:zinc ribbon domain-containing protein [Prochloraceae cyanobacterium]
MSLPPPQYTSQKCSSCGETVKKSLSVRTHNCPSCGYIADRDENTAKNILFRASTLLGATPGHGESNARGQSDLCLIGANLSNKLSGRNENPPLKSV